MMDLFISQAVKDRIYCATEKEIRLIAAVPDCANFCEDGVPPSGDHHAELVESIVLENYSDQVNK